GPEDAPATLKVSSELGSVKIRYDEAPATPLHRVSVTDARIGAEPAAQQSDGAQAESEPGTSEPAAARASTSRPASGPSQDETMRILDMVERHEITPGEAAALLNALRGGQ